MRTTEKMVFNKPKVRIAAHPNFGHFFHNILLYFLANNPFFHDIFGRFFHHWGLSIVQIPQDSGWNKLAIKWKKTVSNDSQYGIGKYY